jgi:hypothetical protein
MKTRIQSVKIINSSAIFELGMEVNGLTIDFIKEETIEFPDTVDFKYIGYTKSFDKVFEIINAPVTVLYQMVN